VKSLLVGGRHGCAVNNKFDLLKNRLFKHLSSFPILENFFGKYLNKIIQRDNEWINNSLVLIILRKYDNNLKTIEKWLQIIYESNNGLFKDLKTELHPSDKEYDKIIKGLLAEIRSVCWMINTGFKNIRKIAKAKNKRTPDFEAIKDNSKYIIEVKNLAAPVELYELLGTAIEIDSLLFPELYSNLDFKIKITATDYAYETINEVDKSAVDGFIENLRSCLKKGKKVLDHNYEKEVNKEMINKSIICKITGADSFDYSINFMNCLPSITKSNNIFPDLLPLIRKTLRVIFTDKTNAIDQLVDYDRENRFEKIILMNWHETAPFKIYYPSTNYVKVMDHIDKIMKEFNPKLSIIILKDE
jgi:hypothetical protein